MIIEYRHKQVLLMFFGMLVAYLTRINTSVAIVAMTSLEWNSELKVMKWSGSEKGFALSAFFWGYIFLPIPTGTLARKWSAISILSLAQIMCAAISFATPMATLEGGIVAMCTCRCLLGLAQGMLIPCIETHISTWALPRERPKFIAFVCSGGVLGSTIIFVVGGTLGALDNGWPAIYYFSGLASLIWAIINYIHGRDCPDTHRSISPEEFAKLTDRRHSVDETKKMKTPWKSIFLSLPVWAVISAHFANNWGFWVLQTLIPTFTHGILVYDLRKNGLLSAGGNLLMLITVLVSAIASDYITKNKVASKTASRKIFNSLGQYGSAAALLAIAYFPKTRATSILLVSLALGLNGCAALGFNCNHLDLSPNLAGTLIGISNSVATCASILGPLISSSLVTDQTNIEQWREVFMIAAIIYIVGNTLFLLFGTAETQPWDDPYYFEEQTKLTPKEGN